ncbi:unnamed protein product [Porites lobata]|uniref:Zinc finger PHD-type domain-containing protein n=1 Tax=Porites lobata TaxID=104759 RepID=A0ABN8Q8X9_9CNID|nr:unnamed protein product [Porites lobata]
MNISGIHWMLLVMKLRTSKQVGKARIGDALSLRIFSRWMDSTVFARNLDDKKLTNNFNVVIERNKLLSNLFGSCYDDVLRMDDNEDWLGCEKCGQFFHTSCLG